MPRLQIPSAISPQGGLSGAVPAPAAQLAQTGAGAVWGAVAGLGQDITGAAKMVYAYEQKLKEAEDKAEMVRLQGEVMETAKDTRHVLATMETDPNTGYEPLWDTYNETAAGWKAKLDENKILSKDAKKEMAIWLQRFDTSERLNVKELVNARRIQYTGAKLWTAQQQAMLAGDRARALEILDERHRLRVIDDMQRAKEELEMDADIDMMWASKLIEDRPLEAAGFLAERDEDGAPVYFKNLPEAARRTLMNSAKAAENNFRIEYFDRLETLELQGKATADTYQDAFDAGYLNRDQYNRKMKQLKKAGDPVLSPKAFDLEAFTEMLNEISQMQSSADLVAVAEKLQGSELHTSLRGVLFSDWQARAALIRKSSKPVAGKNKAASSALKYIIGGRGGIVWTYSELMAKEKNIVKRAQLADDMTKVIEEVNKMEAEGKSEDEIRAYRDQVFISLGGRVIDTFTPRYNGVFQKPNELLTGIPPRKEDESIPQWEKRIGRNNAN